VSTGSPAAFGWSDHWHGCASGHPLCISQILETEETLARGDHIVEGMRSKSKEQKDGR
jgi:hypothetical protein